MCSHLLLFLLSRSKLFLSKHLFDIIMNISNNIRVWCASGGIYLWSKVVCFVLFLSWDLPSHGVPCGTHYIFETLFNVEISQATNNTSCGGAHCIFETLLMTTESASTWFETIWNKCVKAIDYWTIFSMKIK
jgi:hypothetical protein